jgi:hypothetical protein
MSSKSSIAILTSLLMGAIVSAAPAQTFYEPVTFQYRSPSGSVYYYGGHDPRMFQWIDSLDCRYAHLNKNVVRIPVSPTVRVFSDCLPLMTAQERGYEPSDAQNVANAEASRFFRKSEIVAPVFAIPDGVAIPPYARPVAPAEPPATQPAAKGTILIIPRTLLHPVPRASVAVAK